MVLFERLCTTSPLSSLDAAATASSRDSDDKSSRLLVLEDEAADDITQTITPEENTNNANHLILIMNKCPREIPLR